ncbi:hypothetical protein MHU86_6208 [Fragilaria crotonensis]|nr:hypothetical protein MHU86_6208 [Fragilaria crotonensis]
MCIWKEPDLESIEHDSCILVNNTATSVLPVVRKRNVTFRDFTDVANSVANLALSLPNEDARMECLGVLVRMRDALSLSASGQQQTSSVPFLGFMSSAEEFLGAFGPNAESRKEGIFAEHHNSNFEMQRHNIGKVRQKRLKSLNERKAHGAKAADPCRWNSLKTLFLIWLMHVTGRHNVRIVVPVSTRSSGALRWTRWLLLGRRTVPPGIDGIIIRHLSIKAVFYSSEAIEFMSRPTSIYRSKNLQNTHIPSPDNNIVELQLIERGGNFVVKQHETACRVDREVNTTFYTQAKTVQKWMEKASSDSHLFVYVKAKET